MIYHILLGAFQLDSYRRDDVVDGWYDDRCIGPGKQSILRRPVISHLFGHIDAVAVVVPVFFI
jgi:hypothetical protein